MEFAKIQENAATSPKRREARLPATLDVRVFGIDANGKAFHQAATTLDISMSGTRVTGLTALLAKGDIVGLQSSGAKSRFRVSWIRQNKDRTFLVGLQCKEKDGSPWRDSMQKAKETDQRSEQSIPCEGSATLRSSSVPTPIWGNLRDVSLRGCYVQCNNILPEGDILSGQFVINGVQLNALVEVRNCAPAVGMGVAWCDLGYDGAEKLKRILRALEQKFFAASSGKEKAQLKVNELHELVSALKERLAGEQALVCAETMRNLCEAEDGLAAALESLRV